MAILPPRRERRFALDHELPALQALIRKRGELCECLLEIDRDRNLVIQRSRLLPRAGDHRVRTDKMEISRNRRLTVDHLAETRDAVLLAAIHHHPKQPGQNTAARAQDSDTAVGPRQTYCIVDE